MTEADQRAAVLAEARNWIGVGFHLGQCVPGIATDCGRILIASYGAVGIPVPTELEYFSPQFMLHESEERYLNIVERFAARVETPQPADIVAFKRGRVYSHFAIIVNWPHELIHAVPPRVQITDAMQDAYLLAKPNVLRPHMFLSPWAKIG